jgi:hypothetical protein
MSPPASPQKQRDPLPLIVFLPEAFLYFALGAGTIVYGWSPLLRFLSEAWAAQQFGLLFLVLAVLAALLSLSWLLSHRLGLWRAAAAFVISVGVLAFFLTGFGIHLPAHS